MFEIIRGYCSTTRVWRQFFRERRDERGEMRGLALANDCIRLNQLFRTGVGLIFRFYWCGCLEPSALGMIILKLKTENLELKIVLIVQVVQIVKTRVSKLNNSNYLNLERFEQF